MLLLKNIVKDYVTGDTTVRALNDVSIAFRKSEFVSILGHSGCGKTTLLNIIGGLDRYTDGDLKIKGVSTKQYKDHDWDTYRNHSIGFVFQSYNLIPHQTVMSNVELSLTLTGVSKAERRKRAEEVLRRVGLGDQMYKKPSQMSGGQMQRVAIARALINDPEILLADEPTGALDTETSVQIMDILRDISKDKLIIMVTHNPELAEKYSDRIIRLSDGKVVGDTNPYSPEEEESEFSVEQPKEEEEKTPSSKKKRPSMSFLTALSLSLNNLMTKKTRTFMTSFAGSIGIIGIALILSLSNGINAYIDKVQRETLSSYPITLQKEEIDIGGVITSLMGKRQEEMKKREEDKIYSSTVMYDLMTTMMNPEMNSNNLKKFKTFLESGKSEIPDYTVLIRYGYDVDVNAYLMDAKGNYFKADVMALYAEMASNMGMSMSSDSSSASSAMSLTGGSGGYAIWEEILPPAEKGDGLVHEMVREQYDVIAGRWPENKQEIVLVVTQNNEISDMALYSLGLVSTDEMYDAMIAAFKGEAPEETEPLCFTYDELLGIRYKLIPTCDYYYKNSDGEWENALLSDDQTKLNSIISEGLDLEIVGIIRQSEDATSGSISGSLGYTSALTEYIIGLTGESEIIGEQLENDKTDVFTGLPFVLSEEDKISDADKPAAFRAYLDTLSVLKKAELYSKILTTPTDEYVEATVSTYITFMGISPESTKEELKTAVMSQMKDTDPALLEKYFDSFDRDQLYAFIVSMMEEMVRTDYSDKAGKLISDIENEPTEAELDAESAVLILDIVSVQNQRAIFKTLMADNPDMLAMADVMPEAQLKQALVTIIRTYGQTSPDSQNMSLMMMMMTTPEARKAFVSEIYKNATELPESVIDEELGKLSSSELGDVFSAEIAKLAKENYLVSTAPTQSADAKNAKLAAAFDKAVLSYTDEQLALYYDAYVPTSSDSSLKDNLKVLGYADEADPVSIAIYAKDFEDKEKITDLIAKYNSEQENEDDEIGFTDYIGLLMSSVTDIVNGISYVLIFFVSISLVVSSIMIGIITYISVLERTKEIGILRAMGASKKDISRVFNAETLIVGFVSGVIGIVVTLILNIPIAIIIKALSDISGIAKLPFWGGLALVLISMGLTLIAGLIPSGFAAKRDPVESLRSE